ncbi:hypothetical protein [Pseudoxanthomonas mexicana]|uniref:hypothetical protein n=1 Tax=Pseudoxanthomonas mexicana TaxID=128785 RepID=UPI00398A8408
MRRTSVAAAATFALACAAGAPAGDDAFAGRYGHGHTGQPGEPVWIVARDDDGYRVTLAADGSHAQAWVLDAAGRAAFWKKMDWNPATAAEARCLNWGDPPPPTLLEFLGDAPAAGSRPARRCCATCPTTPVPASTGWPAMPVAGSTTIPRSA